MTKSGLTAVLLAAILISALASIGFCWAYISEARELRNLQAQVVLVQNKRALIAALANEALEYSKRDSKIDSILESAGVKPKANSSSPSTKTTAK